jgi:hypothetical protein
MKRFLQYAAQAVVYAGIAVIFGYFASKPVYQYLPPDQAEIKVSFAHGGDHVTPCRKLTREEMLGVQANMRRPTSCPRGRVPLYLEIDLDGKTLFAKSLPPSGLFDDGPSIVYERIPLPVGQYVLSLRMRDSRDKTGFNYERTETVDLKSGQSVAIDFRSETGGFQIFNLPNMAQSLN